MVENEKTEESAERIKAEPYINVPVPIVKEMEGYLDRRASAENSSVISVLEDVLRSALRQDPRSGGNVLMGGPSYVEHRGSTQLYPSGRPKVEWEDVSTRLYVRVTDVESRALISLANGDKAPISEVAYGLVLLAIRGKRKPKLSIQQTKAKHRDWLMNISGVEGVGISEEDGVQVIMVLVSQDIEKLRQQIPQKLEGHHVHLESSGVFHAV